MSNRQNDTSKKLSNAVNRIVQERDLTYLKGSQRSSILDKYSVCKSCGQTFEQIWQPKRKMYSRLQNCVACRAGYLKKDNTNTSKAVIQYEPHPGQLLVHDSDARFKVIAAGSRWGKDRCSIMEFITKFAEMMSEERPPDMIPRVHGWFVAPTYMLARQTWREFKAYFPREWVVNFWESDKIVETVNEGIIEMRSADEPDLLVGVGLDIVIITEAARIPKLEETWINIETRLLSPGRGPGGNGGVALVNSTPKGKNFFHLMYRWGQEGDMDKDPDWESWNFPSWSNPYLAPKDKEYLKRIEKRYPERIYRQEILAEFLAEGNSVFPNADQCATYVGDDTPEMGESYVIGYDPAKEVDYSGVVVRNSRGETVKVMQWTGMPWPLQIENIVAYSRKYNYATVVIDSTGIGTTLPGELEKKGVSVDPVYFTNPEKERLVNHLSMLVEQIAISYPNDYRLVNELKDYQYFLTKTGLIRYSASSKSKHDDLVTAMMLAYKDFNVAEIVLPWMGLIDGISQKKQIV